MTHGRVISCTLACSSSKCWCTLSNAFARRWACNSADSTDTSAANSQAESAEKLSWHKGLCIAMQCYSAPFNVYRISSWLGKCFNCS